MRSTSSGSGRVCGRASLPFMNTAEVYPLQAPCRLVHHVGMQQMRAATEDQAPVIRAERPDDIPAIRAIHDAAFGRPLEGAIVDAMRGGDHWIEDGSLVATD